MKHRKILVEIEFEFSGSVREFFSYLKGWHKGTIIKIKQKSVSNKD